MLEHELGHVIGLADNDLAGDLMDITLGLGIRRTPLAGDLAAIGQGSIAASMATPAGPAGGLTAGVKYARSFATVDAALASIVNAPARHGDADDLTGKKIARPVMAVRHSGIGAGHARGAQNQQPPHPFLGRAKSLFLKKSRRLERFPTDPAPQPFPTGEGANNE